jgi:hypothetical protein
MFELAARNVSARRTASLTLLLVLTLIGSLLLALLVLVRDVPTNVAAHYQRDLWERIWLVEPTAGEPITGAEAASLARLPGAVSVSAARGADATTDSGYPVAVESWVRDADFTLVDGRAPDPGKCEAVSKTDFPVEVGQQVPLTLEPASEARSLSPLLVGHVDRSFPLLTSRSLMVTCGWDSTENSSRQIPSMSGLWVTFDKAGNRPVGVEQADTLQQVVDQAQSGTATTGVLGMFALLVGLLLAAVSLLLGRSTTRTRTREFAVRRALGATRSGVAATSGLEGVMVAVAAMVLVVPLGVVLARWIGISGGASSQISSQSPWSFVQPSLGTVALLALVLGLLPVATAVTSLRLCKADVLAPLRSLSE